MAKQRYIVLLRGINVGGNKKIKMADLRTMLTDLGYDNPKTVLASGNAAFDSDDKAADIQSAIEGAIESTFGFSVSVIVIPRQQIEDLVDANPFDGIDITKDTRLYVTFLPAPPENVTIDIPYHSDDGSFTILQVSDDEVCSVLDLSTGTKSTDAMKILESEFGKNITTRNWNTVLKIATL